MRICKSLLKEYGISWTINRMLYSLKIFTLKRFSFLEVLYEKGVEVKKISLFEFDLGKNKAFLNGLPVNEKNELIKIADNAIKGVIMGFSSLKLDYGNPIDWHYSPLTGTRCDNSVKWYRIPDFDPKRGDIKVIWEASRLTHFLYFARAFLLTSEKKYYLAFSQQIKQWLDSNPYSNGVNYKCGQECTLRMINTLIAYSVFDSFGLATEEDTQNVRQIVTDSYKKVLSNFFYAHKCIKNNHTFSEICGLIIGAWCCDDHVKLKKAYKLLDEEIKNQCYFDGGYNQFSFNYQRFTLQIIECVLKIGEKTGFSISSDSKSILKNSVLLMYQCQDESGKMPNYGSNDGALIFPLTSCGYEDFRAVLNTVYSIIEGKLLFLEGIYDEELLWFSDNEKQFVQMERATSRYDRSGFYTLRHTEGFVMLCLQDFKTRPAHMDQLHIDLWHKGVNVFCDSGTYSYATDLGRELSSTSGHNTLKMQGKEQMNKHGAFLVCDWTQREDIYFDDDSFAGTMKSKNGYTHRREVRKTANGYRINDEVYAESEAGRCEFLFHTPCAVEKASFGFELFHEGEKICSVATDGKVNVVSACRSLYYLKKEEISCISVEYEINNNTCKGTFKIDLF